VRWQITVVNDPPRLYRRDTNDHHSMPSRQSALRARLHALHARASDGIERALAEDHTPHEIAGSFAFGTVVVALPTAGTALVLFAVIAYLVDRASKLALAATLVIFNPLVKWTVYGASYWLGARLLGPVPGVTPETVSTSALSLELGYDVVLRQLLGNAILAVALAAVGYVAVRAVVLEYRRRNGHPVETGSTADSEESPSD
jgi:uncharacterized protein (DUF2062 family)